MTTRSSYSLIMRVALAVSLVDVPLVCAASLVSALVTSRWNSPQNEELGVNILKSACRCAHVKAGQVTCFTCL